MALKRKISKTDYEGLSADIKAEYKAEGNSYVLDVDGGDELAETNARLKKEQKDLKAKLDEIQAKLEETEEEKNKKAGDIAALEKSWKTKLETLEAAKKTAEDALANERRSRYVDGEAEKIAAKFTVPSLIRPHIAKRLDVETSDGKSVVRVLDKDGKPSALTLADLEKEFIDNPEFKAIVVGSRASGGAEARPSAAAVPAFGNPSGKQPTLAELPPKDLVAHIKGKYANEDA